MASVAGQIIKHLNILYSLDTLDTRFTTPSNIPLRKDEDVIFSTDSDSHLLHQKDGRSTNSPPSDACPSLWSTHEFKFYYFCFITIVPLMFKAALDVSTPNHPTYSKYSHLLSDGWMLGRKVDSSDAQYASFRDNVPYLAILLIVHPICRRLYDFFWRSSTYYQEPKKQNRSRLTMGLSPSAAADARKQQRVTFDFWFALIYIIALHGFSAFKILIIVYANYQIAKSVPKDYMPAVTYISNIAILFANELNRGYSFANVGGVVFGSRGLESTGWGAWLDSHGGLIPRWEVLFNFTVLRMISFNMDFHWSQTTRGESPLEVRQLSSNTSNAPKKKQLDPSNLSERDRVSMPVQAEDYSFGTYLAYALYTPLYLAGPILTFNDYVHQSRYKAASICRDRTFRYAFRFIVCLLTMEFILHYIYAVAIFKAKPDWSQYSPFQLSMLGYFNLTIIWLKLLLPWRFFRLWSLLDGIDPPENMARCMSNNYSTLAFWRGWHRSYNRWIVRYIYIPLGGSTSRGLLGKLRSMLNYLAVFTFVALWHDINLRLLMWGWLISFFVAPEVVAMLLFPAKAYINRPNTYRVLCGIGAIGNILMMMVANLVGFAIGVDGLWGLIHGIVGSVGGMTFFALACGTLFVGVQVMFEVRQQEKRKGIRMKC